jgi:hypothetical protein
MKSGSGTHSRINLAIPWPEGRDPFHKMAKELKAQSAAELARQILTEVMQCHFGLEKAKQLGIISPIADSIPPPMYLRYAKQQYEKSLSRPVDHDEPESVS